MGKRSRGQRGASSELSGTPTPHALERLRARVLPMTLAAVVVAAGLMLILRSGRPPASGSGASGDTPYTRVGRNGSVYTVSVPRARAADDQYLLQVAQQLSAEE